MKWMMKLLLLCKQMRQFRIQFSTLTYKYTYIASYRKSSIIGMTWSKKKFPSDQNPDNLWTKIPKIEILIIRGTYYAYGWNVLLKSHMTVIEASTIEDSVYHIQDCWSIVSRLL